MTEPINHYQHDFTHKGRKLHIDIKCYDEPIKSTLDKSKEMHTSVEVFELPDLKTPINTIYFLSPISETLSKKAIKDVIRQIDHILAL